MFGRHARRRRAEALEPVGIPGVTAAAALRAMGDPINPAVVVYSGFGTEARPELDIAALEAEFGEQANTLAPQVHELVLEMLNIEIDWRSHCLAGAGATARSIMATRHPELSDDALTALEWKFTCSWRHHPDATQQVAV